MEVMGRKHKRERVCMEGERVLKGWNREPDDGGENWREQRVQVKEKISGDKKLKTKEKRKVSIEWKRRLKGWTM